MKINIFLISLIYNVMFYTVLGQNCDFDTGGICDWEQSSQDDGDWNLTFSRRSQFTGPRTGHTSTSKNYYIYLDAQLFKDQSNEVIPNKSVTLITPEFIGSSSICFRFYYYMFGRDVNTLAVGIVGVNNQTSKKELFSKKGNQGEEWFCGSISYNVSEFERIYMEAKSGITFQSNVAVDDLSVLPAAACSTACESTLLPTINVNTVTSVTGTTDIANNTGVAVPLNTTPDPDKGDVDINILLYLISIPVALLVTLSIIAIVCYCKKSKDDSFEPNRRTDPETFENPQYEEANEGSECYDEIDNVINDYHEIRQYDYQTDYEKPYYIVPVQTGDYSGPYTKLGTQRLETRRDIVIPDSSRDSAGYVRPGARLLTHTGGLDGERVRTINPGSSRHISDDVRDHAIDVPYERAPDRPVLPPRDSVNFDPTTRPPPQCRGPQSRNYISPI